MWHVGLMLIALITPLVAHAAGPKPDDMVNNPPFAHWSSFPVGTAVTQKETVTLPDGSKLEMVKTFKLLEKSKEKVVVEGKFTQTGAAGSNQTTSVDSYPAQVKRQDVDTPASMASVSEGKETVDVKGKPVEAEWVEATVKSGDEVSTEKVWTAQNIPGGIIKQTLVKKKGDKIVSTSVLELVEYK